MEIEGYSMGFERQLVSDSLGLGEYLLISDTEDSI